MSDLRKIFIWLFFLTLVIFAGCTPPESTPDPITDFPLDDPSYSDRFPTQTAPDLDTLPIKKTTLDLFKGKRERPLVLFIGFDGATWKVLSPLMSKGRVPNFQKLCGAGAYGYLETDEGLSPVSWTSITTGMSKEAHGIWGEKVWENVYRKRVFHLWDLMAEKGWRIGITNYPFMHEKYTPKGGFFAREGHYNPAEVLDGYDQVKYKDYTFEDFFVGQQVYLQKEKPYDAVFCIYDFTDVVQHQSYHEFIIDQYVGLEKIKATRELIGGIKRNADRVRSAYETADRILGTLLELKPDYVFIMSDHGFAVSYFHRSVSFNGKFIESLGLKKEGHPWESVWSEFGAQVEDFKLDASDRPAATAVNTGINIEHPAFETVDGTLKLKSKLSHMKISISYGKSRPPKNFADFVKAAKELKWAGIPFLKVTADKGKATLELSEQTVGKLMQGKTGCPYLGVSNYNANHGPEDHGIAIIAGNGIKKGRQLKDASLYDLTPTLLFLLGLPVAKDMAGKVLTDAIEPGLLKSRPIEFIETYGRPKTGDEIQKKLTTEEMKKLKELGYIN